MVSQGAYDLALTCTVLTMAVSPLVSSAALPLGRLWRRWRKPGAPLQTFGLEQNGLENHVIVAGFGRSGRAVARALRAAHIPHVVIEMDYALLRDMTSEGFPGVWGDAAREEVLAAAGVNRARLLVLTVPDRNTVHLAVERARMANPSLHVIARAAREHHVKELQQIGVQAVVQPEFEGGVEMVRQALVRYECGDDQIAQLVASLRSQLYGGR
jgi:CPA2 family monovalent cation:H+ antiporter-2